jgi:ABC-type bacteriocin/lantibiotic exporter with double-glycine peptidase domain
MYNFYKILDSKYKKYFFLIIFLVTLSTLIDFLSLASIIPFVSILFKIKTTNFEFFNISFLENLFTIVPYKKLITLSILILIIIFLLKNTISIFINLFVFKFAYNLKKIISLRILEKYLHQNYIFHLNSSHSKLVSNLINEVNNFTFYCTLPIVYFLGECILLFLLFLLFITFGYIKIILFLFIFFSIGIYILRKFNKKLKEWSIIREKNDVFIFKNIDNALSGVKEIILLNGFNKFFNNFKNSKITSSVIETNQSLVLYLPKSLLEFLGICFLSLIILYSLYLEINNSEIILIVTFYVALAYRVIPSFNKIISSYQSIKNASSSIKIIIKELVLKNEIVYDNNFDLNNKIFFNKTLELKNIFFKYDSRNENVIENLNITINKGEIIGVFGESGVGKSTFLDILVCLIKPSSGTIKLDNINLDSPKIVRSFQNIIGYVTQSPYILDDTISENIAFGDLNSDINKSQVKKAIDQAKLTNFVDSLNKKELTVIGNRGVQLSGGQKQRIALARCFYFDREIILLDESTNSLDSLTEKEIIESIYSLKRKKTIIIVSHKKEILGKCDKIYYLKNKKIYLR